MTNGNEHEVEQLDVHPIPEIREANDADTHGALKDDPLDEDSVVDIASDESFPASDPPSHTAAGGGEPALSSGYDEEAERALAAQSEGIVGSKADETEPLAYGTVHNEGGVSSGMAPEDAI